MKFAHIAAIIFIIFVICVLLMAIRSDHTISGGAANVDITKDLKKYPDSKFEQLVRAKFEKLFETDAEIAGKSGQAEYYKFPSVYPAWLTRWNKRLELDGYNKYHKIAFEVQGPLHSNFIRATDKTYAAYYNRLVNDATKRKICAERDVMLLIIDYTVPKHLLGDYIKSRIFDRCELARKLNGAGSPCERITRLAEKPANYIEHIEKKPYRDFSLEKRAGLSAIDENGCIA